MIARTIATGTHGRYLVEPPVGSTAAPLLVGFHGYAELAEDMLARLRAIAGSDRWVVVSVQGLNRFYQRRTNEVIAGWMTRQDRELAIADNVAYVNAVVDAVAREFNGAARTVFAGFSQGVAMAFRAATASTRDVRGVIAAAGDIPPEIDATALRRTSAVVLCRGARDDLYPAATFASDLERLRAAAVETTRLEHGGAHEWSADVIRAAGEFLEARR